MTVVFAVFSPSIFAEITAFPVFLARIVPELLTEITDFFEQLHLIFFRITQFVIFFPPIMPGNVIFAVTDSFFDFPFFKVDGALSLTLPMYFEEISRACVVAPFKLDLAPLSFEEKPNSPETPCHPPELLRKLASPIYW